MVFPRASALAFLALLAGGCSDGQVTAAAPPPAARAPERPAPPSPAPAPPRAIPAPAPAPAPAPIPPLPAVERAPAPAPEPAAPEETKVREPEPPPPPPAPPQADPRKDVEAAIAAGRLLDAARLIEQLAASPVAADPAVLQALRTSLEQALAARALRDAFDAARGPALERVREAKEAVARDLLEESEREGRIARALKEMTDRTPLRIQLPGNVFLENVRVTGFAAGRTKLTWPQGEVEYPLELLPEETRGALLAGALAKATPRDHFEVGKLLVHAKDYDRAARCFATAAQRDPALAPFVPDLDRVKRASRLFEGSFKATGSTLGIRWTFGSADEAKDFVALQGTLAVRRGQGLEVEGEKVAIAAVKEIPFRERVKVTALARESDASAHLLGIRFVKPDGGEVLIYGALATSLKAFLVMRVEDGKSQELLAPTPGAAGNRMAMDFTRGRVAFQVGERTVWSGNEGGFTDVMVVLGGSSMSRQGGFSKASALFREVTLLGGVNPLWMSKKTAGFRDAVAGELSKEHQARKGGASPDSLELSVEPLVARAEPAVRSAYQAALEKIRAMRQSRKEEDLAQARQAMARATAAGPAFAPAWYYRAHLEEIAGDDPAAAEYYEEALLHLPDFPEALCARGFLRVLDGAWEKAREDVDRALLLRPDWPEAHLLRARLLREAGDAAGALESARMARRLSPLDPKVQAHAQMLANVVRGPAWPRPNVHETAHYSVRSDLPAAKCRLYAEHLEAVRPVYEEVLGKAAPAGKRAEVLVFNAEEGYYGYMEFTAGDRQEHTLGAFSPWHGQLALFEDVDAAETLRVLAHEGFHQYLHAVAPDVPIWFNEGMAEYVGATRVEKGKVVDKGGIQTGRLDNLKLALKYGWQPVPFEKIMVESQAEFYGQHAPLKYAQAWSMIHFLMHAEGGLRKPLLRAYVDRLMAGDSAREAFEAAFAKEDFRAMEAAWLKHFGLPAPKAVPVPAAGPAAGPEAAPAASDTVDLIALLAARGGRAGEWKLQGAALQSPMYGTLPPDLGYEPPEEYDWKLVVERGRGEGGLRVGLVGGSRSFLLNLDERYSSGLEMMDGLEGRNETTVQKPILTPGKPHTVVCSVRKAGVRVTVDGAVLVDWKGSFARLSLPPGRGTVGGKRLFLWAQMAQMTVSELTVKAVTAAPEPIAAAPKPAAPTLKEIRERLASKNEETRIGAVTDLGGLRDREARALLAEKLVTDTEFVRRAAAQAMAQQKHPSAAEALHKAIQAQPRSAALVNEFILALGSLDMCASIPPLLSAIEVEGGKHAGQALGEILRIGCVEAAGGLAALLKRAEAEEKKPGMISPTQENPNKDVRLAALANPLRKALAALTGTSPGPNETWAGLISRGGLARKTVSVHYCSLTQKTFEIPTGKTVACPHTEGPSRPPHEDTFLKHLPEGGARK